MAKQGAKTVKPRLRFPEFEDAGAWHTERMDRLYSFGRNNILSRDKLNYLDGNAKNIHYGDIHTKFPPSFDVGREQVPFVNHGEALPALDSGEYCIEGDLVFADASEDMNDVGKTMEIVRLHGERVLAGQHTILARQVARTFVTGFGAHLFGSGLIRARIKKEAQGTKVYQISAARLGGIDVTYPGDKAEQQKIADCLTSLDEVIVTQGRKVTALNSHKRGLMQQLFPRPGEARPRLRFPEFRSASEWEQRLLGEIFNTASGGTPDRATGGYWGGSIPWVSTSLVDFNVITSADEFISESGLQNSSAKLFPKGTVLVAMYGQGKTRGKVALLNIEAATNQACAAIYPSDEVGSQFVFLSLCGRYDEMRALSNSGGQENLSQGLIRELPFSFPRDLAEQQRIVDCLSSLDTQIAAEAAQLAALKTHKQGLMQQLFPAPERNS